VFFCVSCCGYCTYSARICRFSLLVIRGLLLIWINSGPILEPISHTSKKPRLQHRSRIHCSSGQLWLWRAFSSCTTVTGRCSRRYPLLELWGWLLSWVEAKLCLRFRAEDWLVRDRGESLSQWRRRKLHGQVLLAWEKLQGVYKMGWNMYNIEIYLEVINVSSCPTHYVQVLKYLQFDGSSTMSVLGLL